jgi:hypothetical protein
MRKNMDIVSFRPGELLDELRKRGDDKQVSIVAKRLLGRTLSMLKAEVAKLQRDFSSSEMQVIFAALHDQAEESGSLADRCEATMDNFMIAEIVKRYRVDTEALRRKLRDLSPAAQFALDDGVAQFRRYPFDEKLGLNGFPSLAMLRRLGFVRTQGPAAWGYCTVAAGEVFSEFILRVNVFSAGYPQPSEPIEDLARAFVALVRAQHAQMKSEGDRYAFDDDAGFVFAYKIALATGWRRFRVIERDSGGVEVVEMKREALMHDLHDGSLRDLVLEGVNAPDDTSTAPSASAAPAPAAQSR